MHPHQNQFLSTLEQCILIKIYSYQLQNNEFLPKSILINSRTMHPHQNLFLSTPKQCIHTKIKSYQL